MSSKVVDLTGDNSSSDDGISVDDRPVRKRWRMSASSSTGVAAAAVSRHSNDSGGERGATSSTGVAAAAVSRHSNDSGGERGDDDDQWKLTKIYTLNELKKSKPIKCSNKDCGLVACSRWESTEGGKPWNSCLDCQAA